MADLTTGSHGDSAISSDEAISGDEASDRRADAHVPWRVFGGVGTFVAVMAAIYWFTSYENAGSVMLAVAAILGLWAGIFLWRVGRRMEASASGSGAQAEEGLEFLPAASPWPLGIGLGFTLVLNGLLIGIWFLIPGLMVLGVAIAGWASQSRHRRLH